MPLTLSLADHATRDDLRIYLERLLRVGRPDARLVVRGTVLAVFGCTQAPDTLTDDAATVLVLRSFSLSAPPVSEPDTVVSARALLDRLARMGLLGLDLELPDATTTAAWAGVLPPGGGWEPVGTIDAVSLAGVAEQGIMRIADTLPDSPGDAVVQQVRRTVWGAEIAPGVPAAAAFAAEAMGFLGAGSAAQDRPAAVRLSTSRTWRRLSTDRGEVLVRSVLG